VDLHRTEHNAHHIPPRVGIEVGEVSADEVRPLRHATADVYAAVKELVEAHVAVGHVKDDEKGE